MVIMVVDGQGGGIGKALVAAIRDRLHGDYELIAVGTNSIATSAMKKAGAEFIATGDNAIIFNAARADIITGSIGIIAANSIMGELSPAVANAIASSNAEKVLVPVGKCKFRIACESDEPLPKKISQAADLIASISKLG